MKTSSIKTGDILRFRASRSKTKHEYTDVEVLDLDHERQRAFVRFVDSGLPSRWVATSNLYFQKIRFLEEETKEIPKKSKRRCNLCGDEFVAKNRFMRFCDMCKSRSELYRFAGSM